MSRCEGNVEFTAGGPKKFKVVFRIDGKVVSELPISSEEEGEKLIMETLRGLQEVAKREGYL